MTGTRIGKWRRILLFVASQAIILGGVVWATTQRWEHRQEVRALPPLRERAFKLTPLHDCPWMVTDEQLEASLRKVYPRFRGPEPKMNYVDHAFRMWGPDALFDDPEALSGAELRDLLLNHDEFAKVWPNNPPFLVKTKTGPSIRYKEGRETASHIDHSLASISETGISRDYPVRTSEEDTTFGELVRTSLRDFSLDEMEYEWSTLAYALFLPPVKSWYTTEGQELNWDRIADRLMREAVDQGVCFSQHRHHSLVAVLRAHDEVGPILSPTGRKRVIGYLTAVSRLLVRSQHERGYWDDQWYAGKQATTHADDALTGDTLTNRLVATGHTMEWLALAPEEVLPPRENLTRAAQWIVRTLEQLDIEQIKNQYAFASHAADALALWRKTTPAEFMKPRLRKQQEQSQTSTDSE